MNDIKRMLEKVLLIMSSTLAVLGWTVQAQEIDKVNATVNTSIDSVLQRKTETILDKAKAELNATEVLAMVMDSKTGAMLTMASSNRYDPSYTPKFANYLYEPGAVMMPIVIAIGIDAKKLLPHISRFTRRGGVLKIGAVTIKDRGRLSNDPMTLEDIFVESSNVGIAEAARCIDGKTLYEGLVRFGLNRKNGIDLPNDRAGYIKDTKQLETDIYRVSTGLGYGLLVTPMHLLKAYSAFVNDGKMPTPHIVNDSSSHTTTVISPKTANAIKRMLIETVKRGTGHNAATQGLSIGGKTGTAHIAKRGKYTNSYHSSFYGFAEDKGGHSYTIGVLVIEPKAEKMYVASRSAVPVFKRIVDAMIKQGLFVSKGASMRDGGVHRSDKKIDLIKRDQETVSYHGTKTISPLKDAKVIKKFGNYTDPKYGIDIFNESITLETHHTGAEVVAVFDGTVLFAGNDKKLGKIVVISHKNNMDTVYARLSHLAPGITAGKKISKGEAIGKIDKELLFQIIWNQKHIDPMKVIKL